jgi:hypothetical protein
MSWTAASPTTSPPLSPPLSGPSSPILSRRIQQRRGSTSAADPWGNHLDLNMNPGRTTSCKLTIVRVNPTPTIQLDEHPPSPQHRRLGGHAQSSLRRPGSHGHTGKSENTRMSFASSSFAPPGSSSPSGSRPASPTHGHGLHRHASVPKPRLTADQLVSLAQQSCNPQSVPNSPRTPGGGSLTAARGPDHASFTAIPDDVFLPFVDRAEEVKALFTSPQPGARLFALLAQTFPPHSAPESPVTAESVFGTDPRKWSSAQLEYWVKQVDRDVAPDEVWVGLVRRCVLYHSELIWERIKGALGAPPELDPDDFEEDPFAVDRPLMFNTLKSELWSDLAAPHNESPPPDLDTESQPTVTPDHVSESHSSASAGGSPVVSTLSIEPVLMTTMTASPVAEHDHPPTRLGGHRMQDISEDVQEEPGENEDEAPAVPPSSSPPREIIQGLRISTGPAPPGLFATSQIPMAMQLRAFSMSSAPQQQQSTRVPSEHPSPPMPSGPIDSSRRRWSYAASNASSEAYDVAGERGPGNPLFPTSFARLALGPTLTAKYVPRFFVCLSVCLRGFLPATEWCSLLMANLPLSLIAIPLYARARFLPRRRFRTHMRSARACCADGAPSRVGRMGGIR